MYNYQSRPLINYIPTVLKNVTQYKALTFGEQPEIFRLFEEIKIALDNQFVSTATNYGVERWESILAIIPKATQTLDERKFTILTKLAESLPYTMRMLEDMLTMLCGEDGFKITLRNEIYELEVLIQLTAIHNFNDVDIMLKRIVPANMLIKLMVEFNQHYKFKKYTHEYLNNYTHNELRIHLL